MTPLEPAPQTLSCGDNNGALLLRRGAGSDVDRVVEIQFAAYAKNRELLGVDPLPLQVDYQDVFETHEVWLLEIDLNSVAAALILQARPNDLLIFSIATDPEKQSAGLGRQLLAAADIRARQLGHNAVRLYTGSTLQHLIDWYGRNGFVIERVEKLKDRSVTHMVKHLN